MATGTIKNLISGFGFILPEGSPPGERNLFFQRHDLNGVAFESLRVGQQVEYEVVQDQDPGMIKASDVRLRLTSAMSESVH